MSRFSIAFVLPFGCHTHIRTMWAFQVMLFASAAVGGRHVMHRGAWCRTQSEVNHCDGNRTANTASLATDRLDDICISTALFFKSSKAKVSVHQLFSDELPDEDSKHLRNTMHASVPAWRLGVTSFSPIEDLALGSVLETRRRLLQRRQRVGIQKSLRNWARSTFLTC